MTDITATDDELRAYLAEAEIPPLLPALAYVTGDLSLLRDELRPDPMLLAMPQGGLTEEQQATARELAFERSTASGTTAARPAPVAVGRRPAADHGVRRRRRRHGDVRAVARGGARAARARTAAAPAGARPTSLPTPTSGWSSSARACRACSPRTGSQQAGVDFVVIEKNDDVGGTWFENTYPGCRVDNPNHNYSYSFAQRHDWPFHFSTQDVLLDYFQRLRRRLRRARSHPVRHRGALGDVVRRGPRRGRSRVRDADGDDETLEANAVISAVGQLNRPVVPATSRAATRSRARRSTRRGGTTTSICTASGWR